MPASKLCGVSATDSRKRHEEKKAHMAAVPNLPAGDPARPGNSNGLLFPGDEKVLPGSHCRRVDVTRPPDITAT